MEKGVPEREGSRGERTWRGNGGAARSDFGVVFLGGFGVERGQQVGGGFERRLETVFAASYTKAVLTYGLTG
jgi:hypothetical protein